MKALILAAGLGTRLAPLTDQCPKTLVKVNGTPILIKQLKNLYDNEITDITVVTGYHAECIQALLKETYPKVKLIHSKDYQITNNMYSAWLAKEQLYGESFLMMNGDVFFDANIITELLNFSASDAIVTEIGNYMEESMKVVEQYGRITQISKNITPKNALGVSIDVYKFSAKGSQAFFQKCDEYIQNRNEVMLWSEVALNDVLDEIKFQACPLSGRWMEIDNHEDLKAAELLFQD